MKNKHTLQHFLLPAEADGTGKDELPSPPPSMSEGDGVIS